MRRTALRYLPLGAGLLLAACETTPEGVSEDDIAFFEDAVASIGCTLETERDYRTVEFQANITRETALAIAGYELGADRAVRLESGGIRLTAGPCAPDGGGPTMVLSGGGAA